MVAQRCRAHPVVLWPDAPAGFDPRVVRPRCRSGDCGGVAVLDCSTSGRLAVCSRRGAGSARPGSVEHRAADDDQRRRCGRARVHRGGRRAGLLVLHRRGAGGSGDGQGPLRLAGSAGPDSLQCHRPRRRPQRARRVSRTRRCAASGRRRTPGHRRDRPCRAEQPGCLGDHG